MKKKLFSWLNNRLDPNTVLGVAIYGHSVNAVCLKKQQGQWCLYGYHCEKVSEANDYNAAIVACTTQICTDVCAVNLVIPHFYYQIVQMDKPAFDDQEIIQSLPWTSKDLVDIDPENIIADFIDYPLSLPMQSKKMTVFITNKQQLLPLVESFQKIKPVLNAITSEEMLLVTLLGGDKYAHMLIVQHTHSEPHILIIRDGQLLLTRRLNGLLGLLGEEHTEQLVEVLGLEIQRSLDFFESQLKQPPIRSVQLKCDDLSSATLNTKLAEFLQIKVIDFEANLDLAQQLDSRFYNALAAAYQLTDLESVI